MNTSAELLSVVDDAIEVLMRRRSLLASLDPANADLGERMMRAITDLLAAECDLLDAEIESIPRTTTEEAVRSALRDGWQP